MVQEEQRGRSIIHRLPVQQGNAAGECFSFFFSSLSSSHPASARLFILMMCVSVCISGSFSLTRYVQYAIVRITELERECATTPNRSINCLTSSIIRSIVEKLSHSWFTVLWLSVIIAIIVIIVVFFRSWTTEKPPSFFSPDLNVCTCANPQCNNNKNKQCVPPCWRIRRSIYKLSGSLGRRKKKKKKGGLLG